MTGSGVVTKRPHEMKMAEGIVFLRKVLSPTPRNAAHCHPSKESCVLKYM